MAMAISLSQKIFICEPPNIIIKGAGEMASGIAWKLHRCGFNRIVMLETSAPLAVRRKVCFSEAVYKKKITVDGIDGILINNSKEVDTAWRHNSIAVAIDPDWQMLEKIKADIVVDAILAKKNLGTSLVDGALVIGCGPGFKAGKDVHIVIETQRGHELGRVLESGEAIADTGIPGDIGGYTVERVLRAEKSGVWQTNKNISDLIEKGETIGLLEGVEIKVALSGVIRGLLRSGVKVSSGMKIGDIDPRATIGNCYRVSEKARAIGAGVLEAIMRRGNTEKDLKSTTLN